MAPMSGESAGYSGTPQARKLGLSPECRLVLDGAPAGWTLVDPPPLVLVEGDDPVDVAIAFARTPGDIESAVTRLAERIRPAGALWIAWPRRAGGHRSDVTENDIRSCALGRGLVDVKVAAIDADWSGLKLVWRRENR